MQNSKWKKKRLGINPKDNLANSNVLSISKDTPEMEKVSHIENNKINKQTDTQHPPGSSLYT